MQLSLFASSKTLIAVLLILSVVSFGQQAGSVNSAEPMSPCSDNNPASAEICATPPHGVVTSPPAYPEEARRTGTQGTVVLSFVVGTDGTTSDFQTAQSLGKACDEAAIAAVRNWKFEPGTYQGKAVPVRISASLKFRLDNSASQTGVPTTSGLSTAEDSRTLEPIKVEKAVYPPEAALKGIQGEVWLKLLVSETGDVKDVWVISGDPVLVKAAVEAAKKSKFKPFIKNGKPAEVFANMPFDFAFKEKVSDTPTAIAASEPATNAGAQRVNLPQGMMQGLLIHKVQPVYPEAARQNRIQGTVLLRAVIGKDGRIRELTTVSGPEELVGAAVGAVQQWRYRPYMVNNEPVDVETHITVNFQLRPR